MRWVHDSPTTCIARVPGGRYRVIKTIEHGRVVETLYYSRVLGLEPRALIGRYPSLERAQKAAEDHHRFAYASRSPTRSRG